MKTKLLIASFFILLNSYAQEKYWKATVTTAEYGLLETNFIVNQKDSYLFGTTKPNANKRIIGGLKSSFAKSMFQKNGSVMELDSVTLNDGKVSGYLIMEKRKYFLVGNKQGLSYSAALSGKKSGKIYGKIVFNEINKIEKPKNYRTVWNEIKAVTEQNIYNKKVLENKEWGKFVSYMNDFSDKAEDDGEFLYGFFYKSKDVPFSHYFLTGNKDNTSEFITPGANTTQVEIKKALNLQKIDSNTFLLNIPAFNFRTTAIDSLMERIINSDAKNLIIDLRENPGGDMEGGMRICEYITDKKMYGGVVLSQRYWNNHTAPPTKEEYSKFKVMTNANYEWFRNEVKNGIDGLSIVTTPLAHTFKGKIYILTSSQTGSVSEPFVYTLKNEKIATVIGGKTAGAVLSMENHTIQNFVLTMPILDYYTFDGNRLDKIGVEPDITCDPKDALNLALKEIDKRK